VAYSFWWNPVVNHTYGWVVPGDIWSTLRAAHWVGWGDLGNVYGKDTALVTFPGIAVLLAPVAMISGALGLSESIAPVFLAKPTSWYLLGPAICLLGSTCLFAFDAVAEAFGADRRRRAVLCWMEAAIIFQVVAIWGHPEDLVALALALYAILAGERDRTPLAAWLWGAAIAVQPLVVLMLPMVFVRTPSRSRAKFCVFAAVPSVVLLGAPLLSQWSATSAVLFRQANFPYLDHATPWVTLSPRLSSISVGTGPGRVLAVVAAILLGLLAARRPPTPTGLLWLCALALCLRCFFESVMVPFYLGPPLAMVVLATATANRWPRLLASWAIAISATLLGFHRASPWGYWVPLILLLAAGLLCAWPTADDVGWWRHPVTGIIRSVLHPSNRAPDPAVGALEPRTLTASVAGNRRS
jgi:hypothetical protein